MSEHKKNGLFFEFERLNGLAGGLKVHNFNLLNKGTVPYLVNNFYIFFVVENSKFNQDQLR